jgi:transcriptional regulator with XRE-family HTH domain
MLESYLRARRASSGQSAREVAESLGVSRTTVLNWESGHRRPTAENLGAWGRVMGLTPAEELKVYRLLAAAQAAA